MGKPPRCDKQNLKKGAWSKDEDKLLVDYIKEHGTHGAWSAIPKFAGLLRGGKSCRLRWRNYLRPDIKRGRFSPEEEAQIIKLHGLYGNRWSCIASHLPTRTDNQIKSFWTTHLKKQGLANDTNLQTQSHSPSCSEPKSSLKSESSPSTSHITQPSITSFKPETQPVMESVSLVKKPIQPDCSNVVELPNAKVEEEQEALNKNDDDAGESSVTRTCVETKFDPAVRHDSSSTSVDINQEHVDYYIPKPDLNAYPDCFGSNEFTDFMDSELKMMLAMYGGNYAEPSI